MEASPSTRAGSWARPAAISVAAQDERGIAHATSGDLVASCRPRCSSGGRCHGWNSGSSSFPPPLVHTSCGAALSRARVGGVDLLRSRHLHARDVDGLDERPDVVRPWTRVVLRVPPRGGDPVLRARGRARPRLRAGPLGDRLRDRAELQQAVGGVRPCRPRGVAREGVRRGRGGARVRGSRRAGRAGAHRGAREPLPGQRPVGRPRRVERRLRRGDACRVPRASRRSRRRGAVRRRADEPHAVGAVGSLHGPAVGGCGDARGQGGARARARPARRPHAPPDSCTSTCT